MSLLYYLRDFVACVAAVYFYGRLMAVPQKPLWFASLNGAVAYVAYRLIFLLAGHELVGYLVASFLVAASSEILARLLKKPATVFVLPGIIPLVPGVGLYRTMLCLVQNDLNGFVSVGVRTLFISGIIAVTVAVTNAAARNFFVKRPIITPSDNGHTSTSPTETP